MSSQALTWGRAFTAWTLEPWVLVLVLVVGGLYVAGLRRLRANDEEWPVNRTIWFFTGLALWLVSVSSFIGVYERILFTDRAVQAVLLLMVVPLFLAMGAPVSLLAAALPPDRETRLRRALTGRVSRALMFPAVCSAVLIAPPWLFYFTPLYDLTLRNSAANIVLHFAFVFLGLLYFWPRLQLDPVGHEYPHLVGVFITFAEVIFDGALGIVLIMGGHLVGGHYYGELHRSWGPSLRQDQIWGGGAFWVLGDLAGLPFLAALVVRLLRQDRRQAVQIDRELDVQYAAEKAAAGLPDEDSTPEMMRPWWETDPILSKRYGRGTQ